MVKNNNKTENRITNMYIICISVIVILVVTSVIFCSIGHLERLEPLYIRDVSIDITGMILGGLLLFSLFGDKPRDKHNRALFRLVFTLCLLFYFDLGSSFMEGHPKVAFYVLLTNTLIFFSEAFLIYCFWAYLREELEINKKDIPVLNMICKGTLLFEMILDVVNIFSGFLFTVNANGDYIEGKFEGIAELPTLIIYLTIWFVMLKAREHPKKERLVLLTFQVFPVIVHILSVATGDFAMVYPAYLFSVMLIYINVFARRSKKILEQQVVLDKQSTALMISQIQPHFLYNVLTTISNLCVTDPEEAEETTVLFSQYLRTNLDSLRQTDPVPFKAELGHIRTYAELEKKRFGEKLNVEFDCPETDFLVPSLGLQPIVENSIKHGIRGKDSPGHVKISSKKTEKGYEVVIEDDGIGFDMAAPVKEDGRSHVGMTNVRNRLKQMCEATMEVESSPGNGCRTTVIFPLS